MNIEIVHKLTKEEVKALKSCDHISFVYEAEKGEGKAIIRATKELKRNVWEKEKTIEIEAGNQMIGKNADKVKRCYYNLMHVEFTHWPTIAENLKEGDRLVIRWHLANNNRYLNDAGLFADDVFLDVYREGNGRGMKVKRYFVGYSVCQNNTARMCQVV